MAPLVVALTVSLSLAAQTTPSNRVLQTTFYLIR